MIYPPYDENQPASSSLPTSESALKWTALTHANFKLNGLKRIDESMVRVCVCVCVRACVCACIRDMHDCMYEGNVMCGCFISFYRTYWFA